MGRPRSCLCGTCKKCKHAEYMRRYTSIPENAAKSRAWANARYRAKIGRAPAPRTRPLADRFWEKVSKTETCWLWTGATASAGYGVIWVRGRLVHAHRVSLELAGVEIPEGYDVDHLCYVPACVRPDHLEPVTHRENMARARARKAGAQLMAAWLG